MLMRVTMLLSQKCVLNSGLKGIQCFNDKTPLDTTNPWFTLKTQVSRHAFLKYTSSRTRTHLIWILYKNNERNPHISFTEQKHPHYPAVQIYTALIGIVWTFALNSHILIFIELIIIVGSCSGLALGWPNLAPNCFLSSQAWLQKPIIILQT